MKESAIGRAQRSTTSCTQQSAITRVSTISDHHPFDRDHFTILSTAANKYSVAILEAIFIKINKPSLNRTQDTEQLITI